MLLNFVTFVYTIIYDIASIFCNVCLPIPNYIETIKKRTLRIVISTKGLWP